MDEKLKADLDAALAKIDGLEKERDALTKRLDTPEEVEKRKLEALPESVRKEIAANREEIAKMRAERAEAEQVDAVKKSMPQLPGKPEDTGKLLKRAKDVLATEDFEALVTVLKAASAQIEKGGLFREIGKGGESESRAESPFEQAMRLANELVAKSKDVKIDEALSRVFAEHPDLYTAYAMSVRAGANSDRD